MVKLYFDQNCTSSTVLVTIRNPNLTKRRYRSNFDGRSKLAEVELKIERMRTQIFVKNQYFEDSQKFGQALIFLTLPKTSLTESKVSSTISENAN